MDTQQADKKSLDWGSFAIGFLLAVAIAVPITAVATTANSRLASRASVETVQGSSGFDAPAAYPSANDAGDVGTFAHGYLEFDANPAAPGGVPGFDSWPPASSRR